MKRSLFLSAGLLGTCGVAVLPLRAGELGTTLSRGPVIVGNDVPDGLGATLGRFFVLLTRPGDEASDPVPLELYFTSSTVTVDPVTCSDPSDRPCHEPGRGIAGVGGYPTAVLGPVMSIKMASALYFSRGDGYLPGHALEVALEGSLYAGVEARAGEPCELRLFLGNPAYLLQWAGDSSTAPSNREYRSYTGSGLLVGDIAFFFFPGWLRGTVSKNDGSALSVELASAKISPVRIGDETRVWIQPDFNAARKAGLPEGVFGRLEVNYSGFATPSQIVPEAVSNDVELRVTAVEEAVAFIRGDCNGDGSVAAPISDALTLLRFSFTGGSEPPCLAACDADGDGRAVGRVVDAVYLLRYHFMDGEPPPPPFPDCGRAERASEETCAQPGCR